ncbi:uncharacterized protein [Branchiostoma lanceolatum]|uniref:uncharacterized protein n=1 Tax=Branchiostoma lanceolatum TaxID=7740 RepID=UPI003453A35F
MNEKRQPTAFQRYQLLQLDPDTDTGDSLALNEALLRELSSGANNKDHVPVISFIGGAGVGKSSLVCSLLEDSVDAACLPIIAAPHQMLTETAGVYVYPCTTLPSPGGSMDYQRVILADFEGAGGQIPRTVNQHLLEEVPIVHWLHRIVGRHLEKRKQLTMKTLPSLAFLLSDVVVYVHQSPVCDFSMLETIAAIARDASEGVEHEWKPSLVILQNKNAAINSNIDGIDTTDSFLDNIHMSKELQKLYQSVKVMSLPQNTNEETFKQSVNVLKSKIGELCRDVSHTRQATKILSVGISCLLSEKLFWTLCEDMIQCVNAKLKDNDSSRGEFSQNLPGLVTERLGRIDKKPIFFDRFFTQVSESILGSNPDQEGGITKYRDFYDKLVETAIGSLTGSIAYTLAANASMYGEDDDFIEAMEPEIQNILENSRETVESYCPCRAESPPLEDGEMFRCTLTAGEHGNFHENLDARAIKTSSCFWTKEEDCSKWEGEFEGRATSPTSDECIKQIQEEMALKNIREIAKAQVEVLQRFEESDLNKSTDVCTICFSGQAEPPLPCGHRMCAADLKLLTVEGNVSCPFGCQENLEDSRTSLAQSTSSKTQEDPVSIPESNSIGVRVLALDGGGAKGIFQATVLDAVHKRITPFAPGIPFRELFDLIIGTSIGSAVGMAIGRMNYSPRNARNMLENLLSTVFQKSGWRRFSGTTLAVLSGNVYSNKNLQKVLADIYGETRLSGVPLKIDSRVSPSSPFSLSQSQPSETLRPRGLRPGTRRLSMSVDMLHELKEENGHTQFEPMKRRSSVVMESGQKLFQTAGRRRSSVVMDNGSKMFQHMGRRQLMVMEEEETEFTPPTKLVLPVVACCACDIDRVKTVTISGHDCSLKAREAVLASTAAPTYFPPVQLIYKGEQRNFCDGGIGANCPAGEAKKLAKEVWPDRRIDTMLSVGCGGDPDKASSDGGKPGGIAKIGAAVLGFVVRTRQHWVELEKDNDCFVRLDAPARVGIAELPLDYKDTDKIKRLAASWLDELETQQQVCFFHITHITMCTVCRACGDF